MEKMCDLSDEELINMINNGNSLATSELFGRYRTTLKQKCRVFSASNMDYEDLLQEGMIGLYTAIQKYNASTGVPFNFLAKVCINHQILNALKASKRKKHEILNNSLSLNSIVNEESDQDKIEFMSLITSKSKTPESVLLDTEKYNIIKSLLSPLENQIFLLFLDGYTYFDIAREVGTTKKAVDNALQRIKKKLSESNDLFKN